LAPGLCAHWPRLHLQGGLGGEPGSEAHGGYTYCGLAALALLGRVPALDVPRLLAWASQQQRWMEGGFAGRTNKLPDGCYSFWQGGAFPLMRDAVSAGRVRSEAGAPF
jgi:protein farnesyltransferase subunit beta